MSLNQWVRLHLILLATLCLIGFAGQASAANSQQQKMTACNADASAKNLKGDDRKAFMKSCLSAAPATATSKNSQQEKMKACNADAKSKALAGDARKQFMKTCLSGAQSPAQ